MLIKSIKKIVYFFIYKALQKTNIYCETNKKIKKMLFFRISRSVLKNEIHCERYE